MPEIKIEARDPNSSILCKVMKNEGRKREILVIEDNEINREILKEMLQTEFTILTAEDGEEGIQLLKKYREKLSLILLDVYMPVCNGFQFLERTQKDPFLSSVPVIVATGSDSSEDEEKCLKLGAMDVIAKPYTYETMLGRIHNVIRLHESISALSIVEFDRITGIYTMSAFLHHAAELLKDNDNSYDLGILGIQDFSSIKRIYGEKKGNEILKYVADKLKEALPDAFLARQDEYFFSLCASGDTHSLQSLESCYRGLEFTGPVPNLKIREGLYLDVDKTQTISVLCDRVKLALTSSAAGDLTNISYYDQDMEANLLKEQNMKMSFDSAIENHEFVIWIQPKVEILTGKIIAGEALVRWIDSNGNFISPGEFIPLFEREGQIQSLDEYIFKTVCNYQERLKRTGKKSIPISINLSRNSLFSEGIVQRYRQIANDLNIDLALIPLEITESAATSEKEIEKICEGFVKAGFHLQMDDFGTGYSSLSALATLPFEVVKLDKALIDQIGTSKGDILIKNIIKTAHELGLQVVAEGVEEKLQAQFLAGVDCNLIQGFYYSPPKKTDIFEKYLEKDNPFPEKVITMN